MPHKKSLAVRMAKKQKRSKAAKAVPTDDTPHLQKQVDIWNRALNAKWKQLHLLNNAITEVIKAYSKILNSYTELHPLVWNNHLVNFRHRMACSNAFANQKQTIFARLLERLSDNAGLVFDALQHGFFDIAEMAFQAADQNMEGMERHINTLGEAVGTHFNVQQFLTEKRILKDTYTVAGPRNTALLELEASIVGDMDNIRKLFWSSDNLAKAMSRDR